MRRSVFLCATAGFAAFPRIASATVYDRVEAIAHRVPGVIGAYDMINLIVGPTASPPATAVQLRGWSPSAQAEPFIFVGLELLGQTTTETVYEVQMRTRVQL